MPDRSSEGFNLLDAKKTAKEYASRAGLSDPERELKELAAEQKQKETQSRAKRRVY